MSLLLALLLAGVAVADDNDEPIMLDRALVTLIEQRAVPARDAGVLQAVNVTEGQRVAIGDELARLDDSQAQLTDKKARIEHDIARVEAENDVKVRFAEKSTEVAKAELKRATESLEKYKRSISATEIDKLRLEADRTVLQIEQAQQELKSARFTEQLKQNEVDFAAWNLDRMRIKSPLAGVVVEVNHHPGEWVEPGETVMRIVRMDRLRVEAFLEAARVTPSLEGREVTLVLDLPGQSAAEFRGKLVFINPEVDPVNGQVRIWAEVENPDLALRPGLHGTLKIGGPRPAETKASSDAAATQR